MGEKHVHVVFGCYTQGIPGLEEGPPEDQSWEEWLHELCDPVFAPLGESWTYGVQGVRFHSPYESAPEWIGFHVMELSYGQTWAIGQHPPGMLEAAFAYNTLIVTLQERAQIMLPRVSSWLHTTSR